MLRACIPALMLLFASVSARAQDLVPAPMESGELVWSCAWTSSITAAPENSEWRPCRLGVPPAGEHAAALWQRAELPVGRWNVPAISVRGLAPEARVEARAPEDPRVVVFSTESGDMLGPSQPAVLRLPLGTTTVVVATAGAPGARLGLSPHALLGDVLDLKVRLARSSMFSLGIDAILAMLAAGSLLFWAWGRQSRVGLAFAAFGTASALLVFSITGWHRLAAWNMPILSRTGMMGVSLLPISIAFLLLQHGIGVGRRWFMAMLGPIAWFTGMCTVLAATNVEIVLRFAPLFVLVMVLAIGASAVAAFQDARAGRFEAWIFIAALGPMLLLAGVDTLRVAGVLSPGQALSPLSLVLLACAFGVIASRRSRAAVDEVRASIVRIEAAERRSRHISARLAEGARELLAAVGRLQASGTAADGRLARQAAALQQSQVTAEEIRRTSMTASEKARLLLDGTEQADAVGRHGEKAIEETLAGIGGVGSEVSEMAIRIAGIEAQAREMVAVVETVAKLADQTNILALNAAVEAMRSGERGRSFSVVAREIRRLADQSIAATTQIREVLEQMTSASRDATAVSRRGQERISAGLAQVRASGDRLKQLSVMLIDTNADVRQISAAVSQQHAGVTQIFAAIEDLSKHAAEMLARLQESNMTTAAVERVARNLSPAA